MYPLSVKQTYLAVFNISYEMNLARMSSCFFIFFSFFPLSIRYHGSSSSIKCHVYHHVGGRRHTPVVCNERRKPIPVTIPVTKKTTKTFSVWQEMSKQNPVLRDLSTDIINLKIQIIGKNVGEITVSINTVLYFNLLVILLILGQ